MLRLHPERRSMSDEMLLHPWLAGITVEGEIEAASRIEARMRACLSTSAQDAAAVELANEQDALKPVGSLSSTPAGSLPSSFTEPVPQLRSDGSDDPKIHPMCIDPVTPPDLARVSVSNHSASAGFSTSSHPYALHHHHHHHQPQHPTTSHPPPPQLPSQSQPPNYHTVQTPQATAVMATPRAGPTDHRPTSNHSRAGSPSPHALPRPVATPVQ